MERQQQLKVLPTQSIEEYYPDQFRKTPEEVQDLGKKLFLKRELAKHVASQITVDQFQEKMPRVKEALDKCWLEAYQ